ncbi:MAG: cob(I)yrinic acid a,c-diamide adenosyltransferase [Chitinispirillaceae bacterium]|nr:cob(I)yrinic acid a,c-diamide adenosyltransferase [Chitinispirillaceae bacterium]
MAKLKKGYVHLYTGNGKGKTTAALGLALRAAGAGLRVYIAQFAKGTATGELKALKKLSGQITVRQFGRSSFIKGKPSRLDIEYAARGIAAVKKAFAEGRYDMIVLDELCGACRFGLVSTKEVVAMLKSRSEGTEAVITGRNAPVELVKAADIVTEMKEVKHYFMKGVFARRGIEY